MIPTYSYVQNLEKDYYDDMTKINVYNRLFEFRKELVKLNYLKSYKIIYNPKYYSANIEIHLVKNKIIGFKKGKNNLINISISTLGLEFENDVVFNDGEPIQFYLDNDKVKVIQN